MMTKTFTPQEAQAALDRAAQVLREAGIPADLVRASAHDDTRGDVQHQTYLHIEAWAPGPGLAAELDAIEAKRAAEATPTAPEA